MKSPSLEKKKKISCFVPVDKRGCAYFRVISCKPVSRHQIKSCTGHVSRDTFRTPVTMWIPWAFDCNHACRRSPPLPSPLSHRPWRRIPRRFEIKRLKHFVFAITRRVIGSIDAAKITVIEGLINEARQMDNLCYSRLFSSPRVSGSSARPGIDLSVHASSSPWSACCSAIGELFRLWDAYSFRLRSIGFEAYTNDLFDWDWRENLLVSSRRKNERKWKFKINGCSLWSTCKASFC